MISINIYILRGAALVLSQTWGNLLIEVPHYFKELQLYLGWEFAALFAPFIIDSVPTELGA